MEFRSSRTACQLSEGAVKMATLKELANAIDSLLNHELGVARYKLTRQTRDKAYEAYIFCLCLRAARELGGNPVLRGIGSTGSQFIFRGAPGSLFSTSRNYGYAEFSLNRSYFEIHVGVEYRGGSGMTHEFDVSIIRAQDAENCRQDHIDPKPASLIAGWECKFYSRNLDKGLGRAFVGLMDDMGSNIRLSGMCSNSSHPQLKEYFRLRRRPFPHFELTPLKPSNEAIFVNQLKGVLKKMTGL